jgi:NAD(P)-dependent dehydrogenase (short-subunit alcohol dehydrogenase family)
MENCMTTPQQPIGSGLSPASTAHDAIANVDLGGKTAIVTGGYSGLGLETVRALAQAGARVIVPARDLARAEAALQDVPGATAGRLDLTDGRSIDEFAARFLDTHVPLHILVNSAGVMATPFGRDALGHESQFSTNHLGHFRLANALWPALRSAGGARVVAVSSRGHQIAGVDFDDIDFERREYDKWIAYGQSKTANILFAVELDARGAEHGIRAFSVHPGTVLGPLARHLTPGEIASFKVHDDAGNIINAPERDLKSAAQGAATIAWCAASPQLAGMGGVYCEDCDIAPVTVTERFGVRERAIDPVLAKRLWSVSAAFSQR